MKKRIAFTILTGCLLFGTLTVSGCKDGQSEDITGVFDPYEPSAKEPAADENLTFDGELDESLWTGAKWHQMKSTKGNRGLGSTMTLVDCEARGTIITTEEGLYVGFDTDDPVVYTGQTSLESLNPDFLVNAFAKSGFSVYLTYKTDGQLIGDEPAYEIGFAADGTYTFRYKENDKDYWMGKEYTNWGNPYILTGARIKGERNTDQAQGYSIEAFIPWDSLPSLEGAGRYPEQVTAAFGMERFTGVEEDKIQTWEMLGYAGGQKKEYPHTWDTYDRKGYVARPQGAVFGSYEDHYYDSAFDVSRDIANDKDAQISFTSTTRRESYIYVEKQSDTTQFAEAHIKIGKGNTHDLWQEPVTENDQWFDNQPMVGFIFRSDIVADQTAREHEYTFYSGVDVIRKDPLQPDFAESRKNFAFTFTSDASDDTYFGDPLGGWLTCGEIPCNFTSGYDFKLTVIREGDTFYTYVNDSYTGKRTSKNIGNDTETYMGLLVQNTSATISDYTFLSGAEARARIDEYAAVREGTTFRAARTGSDDHRMTLTDADFTQDTKTKKKASIAATLNQQIEAHVKNVPGNSNKVYAEFTVKLKEKPTMGYGRVALALTNADQDTVYFGLQVPNTGNMELLASWSAKNGVDHWAPDPEDKNLMVAFHSKDTDYQALDQLYHKNGLKLTVYGDGKRYYFFADGEPIYCYAKNGTYIRNMAGKGDGDLNVSGANIKDIRIAVDCEEVEISDYTFLYGGDADAKYGERFAGETFEAKDFDGGTGVRDYVDLRKDRGKNPSVRIKAPVNAIGIATVKKLNAASNKAYAEFHVKLHKKEEGAGYVILALENEEGRAVQFGLQINNKLEVDDLRSWSTQEGGVMLDWDSTVTGHDYAVHGKDTDYGKISSALNGDGVKLAVYTNGTNYHFYVNGVAVKAFAGDSHIRNMNMGSSNLKKIGIAVTNADVTISKYSFVLGDQAMQAHSDAHPEGCHVGASNVGETFEARDFAGGSGVEDYVDLRGDRGADPEIKINAPVNATGVATVKKLNAASNKAYAEFHVKLHKKEEGAGYVILALENEDGKAVQFGLQVNNLLKVDDIRSWSTQKGGVMLDWASSAEGYDYAVHGKDTDYEAISSALTGDSVKVAVYTNGTNYHFYVNGVAVKTFAGDSHIRSMNVGSSNLKKIGIAVTNANVTISDYTFVLGDGAEGAHSDANLGGCHVGTANVGETFEARDFDGGTGVWDYVDLRGDQGDAPRILINAPAGATGVATVKEPGVASNKVFAEYTVKFNQKAAGGGYVILAMENADGKAVQFGLQINDLLKVDDIRSWSTQKGGVMLDWASSATGHDYAVHGKDTDYDGISSALNGNGVKVAVYSDGSKYHFYVDGVAVKAYAGDTHIRNMNVGTSAIKKIGIAVTNANVTISDYTFVLGDGAEGAHNNANLGGCHVSVGETFEAKDFAGGTDVRDCVNLGNDQGADPSMEIKAPGAATGVATVKELNAASNQIFAEYNVRFNGKESGYGYVILALENEDGKAVQFGLQINDALTVDDIRSWSTQTGGVMLDWAKTDQAPYAYAVHGSGTDFAGITSALKDSGVKVAVYGDGTDYHFYVNGVAVRAYAGDTHIRNMNVGTSNLKKIGIAATNADVTISKYSFVLGSQAEQAYTNANLIGCKVGETFVAKDFSGAAVGHDILNLQEDKGSKPEIGIKAPAGKTGVATVKELNAASNKVFAEYTVKFNGKDIGGGYVILALENADGKAVQFGFQINNSLGVDDIRSWSTQSGGVMLDWTKTDQTGYEYAVHGSGTDFAGITSALKGNGVKVAVYSDGTDYHFYVNGMAVKAWAGDTHIRDMKAGTSAITKIGIAVTNADVTISDYSFVLGSKAEWAHTDAGLICKAGNTFEARDFAQTAVGENLLDLRYDKGSNPSIGIKASGNVTGAATVKELNAASNQVFAEYTVKLNKKEAGGGYVILALENDEGKAVHFGFQVNNSLAVDDIRSWSTQSGGVMLNWAATDQPAYGYAVHGSGTDFAGISSALTGNGVKVAVYSDGTDYHFYVNGVAVKAWAGDTHIRNMNVGLSDIKKIGIAATNADVTISNYSFVLGGKAEEAHKSAGLNGCP